MNQHKSLIKFVIITILIITISGCAEWRSDKSLGTGIDDSVIATKVRSALISDKNVSFRNLDVQVDHGYVELSGFVNSHEQALAAVHRAASVNGVKAVYNRLIVRHARGKTSTK